MTPGIDDFDFLASDKAKLTEVVKGLASDKGIHVEKVEAS